MSINVNSNRYVLMFAIGICTSMSALLAVTQSLLKETQAAAREFDRQKNVMIAGGLIGRNEQKPRAEFEQIYKDRVEEKVLTLATGEFHAELTPQTYAKLKGDELKKYRVIAIGKGQDGQPESYILPTSGKGLWSVLYGYIALGKDGNTVVGITFYEHGETPGLGGEVENPDWTAQWVGKTILEGDQLVSITVKKGKVDPSIAKEKAHAVDGLSGATITCNGVNAFLKRDFEAYRPFLQKIWEKK
jgi:Na+-transporting NADH:ubiquinone oxidoreductase subunit C